jgi:hypothetical protein
MMANERVPKSITAFIAYMQITVAYLLKASPAPFTNLNWQRLGWLSAELAAWQNFLAEVLPYNVDKKHRTPSMTAAIKAIIDSARAYDKANHMIDRTAAASPTVTNIDDYTTFNIRHSNPALGGSLPTARRTATENIVWFILKAIGGGAMKYEARADKSSKRASKLKGYDLGIMYLILNTTDAIPTTVDLLTQLTSSSKAANILHLAANTAGKRIAISMYWKHKTNPALNGPPSAIQVVQIS